MALTFKCPQCVAASLTSQVGVIHPLCIDQQAITFNTNGSLNLISPSTPIVYYFCTRNHCGYTSRPTGL